METKPYFTKNGFRKESALYRIFYRKIANLLHFRSSFKSMTFIQKLNCFLLNKAKEKQVDKHTFLWKNVFQRSPNTVIDFHEMKNRDYYWLFIYKDNVEIEAPPPKIGTRSIQATDLQLDTLFNRVKNAWKNKKLKEFYFELLHRKMVTKTGLSFYRTESDMQCLLYQEPDSVSHFFQSLTDIGQKTSLRKSSNGAIKKMASLSCHLRLKYCLVWSKRTVKKSR